jgi:hypothetical protein
LWIGILMERSSISDYLYDHVGKDEEAIVNYIQLVRRLFQPTKSRNQILGNRYRISGHVRYRDGYTITTSNLKGFKNFPLRDSKQTFSIPSQATMMQMPRLSANSNSGPEEAMMT